MKRLETPLRAPNMVLLLPGSWGLKGAWSPQHLCLAPRWLRDHSVLGNEGMDRRTNSDKDLVPTLGPCYCPILPTIQRIIRAWAPLILVCERAQEHIRLLLGLMFLSPGRGVRVTLVAH